MLRTYLADACADGASILDRSEARRILVRDGRVEGVVAAVPRGEITVRARRVALAGGSVHSPVLLQRSGIAPGVAGRTLRMHPVTAVAGVYPERIDAWSGVPQSVVSDAFAEIDGTHGFRVEASPMHPGIVGTALPWWSGPQHAASVGRAAHTADFLAGIERRGVSPNRVLLFTAHQMSSCRIGTDPKDSTADPDGRVRGVDGLWVTDASAFPTASGVNPMLTILALTRRTAQRMAES